VEFIENELRRGVDFRSHVLAGEACVLLGEFNIRAGNTNVAAAWLNRGLLIQSGTGPPHTLVATLVLLSTLLRKQGRELDAQGFLTSAESVLADTESDECVKANLQLEIANTEICLGDKRAARRRLSATLPTLRRRKRCVPSQELLQSAAGILSKLVEPTRRLRRKTFPEAVQNRGSDVE